MNRKQIDVSATVGSILIAALFEGSTLTSSLSISAQFAATGGIMIVLFIALAFIWMD